MLSQTFLFICYCTVCVCVCVCVCARVCVCVCVCVRVCVQLELTHHIPKATQNWVIGNQLVKGDMLLKTLRDFGIDGSGTTAKVCSV